MNERLLELAEQAEEYASVEYAARRTGYDKQYFFETKFAELIIKECCKVIDDHYEPVYDGELIKRYFGVEE